MERSSVAGPVAESERIAELDVLRGVALFGVLTMNFVAFAMFMVATPTQLGALPTADIDQVTYFGVRWLIGDKANTVFATLFGLGFYLQLKRGENRPGFEARYRRRLTWLLVFGLLNLLFVWTWDILHLYAIGGFVLLAMRRWSARALLITGTIAAVYSDKLQLWLVDSLGFPVPSSDYLFAGEAVLQRQALAVAGDYPGLVGTFANFTLVDWLIAGNIVAWIVYAVGRFALGAAIGRSGILEDLGRFLPSLRKVAWVALPSGLLLNFLLALVYAGGWSPFGESEALHTWVEILRSPAALLLAAAYCAAIVVALQKAWGRRLFGVFAPVGRMALTNYLAQGLLIGFVLFAVGPGLGLAGKIGSFAVVLTSIAFFALQIAYSHWWLTRFRFGPMEWLWRALTYRERPPFRRAPVAAAATA